MTTLHLRFSFRGLGGLVSVSVMPNDDPARWGYELLRPSVPTEQLAGFPVCTASVSYPADGYAAVLGWIQFAQSTDSDGDPSAFELDPIHVYRDIATPFAWFGIAPTLFDAPSRESRNAMRWRARSWLCAIPDAVISREVQPICGFEWGFDCANLSITLSDLCGLPVDSWKDHVPTLSHEFPTWTFHEQPA